MKNKRVLKRIKAWLIFAMDKTSEEQGASSYYMAYSKVLRNIVSEEIKYTKKDSDEFEKQLE